MQKLCVLTAFWAMMSYGEAAQAVALPKITEFTLKNGMDVVMIEDHHIPAISHNLLFRVGAADDPRGKSGLAHYLEHMLFQGTKRYQPNEYSHQIANKGGQHNAFTSADYTGYWVNIAKENLPLVMELEADRLSHLNPTQANFDREKQVILEERRMRVDNNPEALFDEQMNALLYYHHPYGTPIIGWQKEMEALDRPTVMQYYREYYHPANAVLVLAGDFNPATLRKQVEQYYGGITAGTQHPAPRLEEPPQLGMRRFTMHHAQVQQAQWQRSYLTPSYHWQDKNTAHLIPLMIAEHLLGGSKTSRLYRRLVEQDKVATAVSVSFNPFTLSMGQFDVYATPISAKAIPAIEKAVKEELAALQKTPPSEEEMARARTSFIASGIYARDGLQSLAQIMGHLKMIHLPLDYYFTLDEKVAATTADQVQKSLGLLNPDYSVTGVLLPKQ
jgi:zinc protease